MGKGWYYLSHYEKKRIPRIEVIGVKIARLPPLLNGAKIVEAEQSITVKNVKQSSLWEAKEGFQNGKFLKHFLLGLLMS